MSEKAAGDDDERERGAAAERLRAGKEFCGLGSTRAPTVGLGYTASVTGALELQARGQERMREDPGQGSLARVGPGSSIFSSIEH